jgi:hypothetical protein
MAAYPGPLRCAVAAILRYSSGIVEDGLHVFACSLYEDLRWKHGFTEPENGSDAVVKAIMNPAATVMWSGRS